ncbi:hypothetical protein ABIB62_000579 [Mucilaginibacter sp. UYP25]|uniref:hypothetical protein n=1 Tax=unclassified Mucilaginibacter TaxID=2617802 RepID=UPI0033958DAD
MKNLIYVTLLVVGFPYCICVQKTPVNYGIADSANYSLAYKNLHSTFDQTIAYTTEGYWLSYRIIYSFVSVKNKTYFKGSITLKRNKNHWTTPLIKYNEVNTKKAVAIFKQLVEMGLWTLNVDSLNNQNQRNPDGSISKLTLNDGTNYRFELIEPHQFSSVEAYEPEYFLKELPQFKQRELFIRVLDAFKKAFKTL